MCVFTAPGLNIGLLRNNLTSHDAYFYRSACKADFLPMRLGNEVVESTCKN